MADSATTDVRHGSSALTSKRVYKSAWEHGEAIDSLRAWSGQQFAPALAEIFLSHQDELHDIRLQYPD